METNKIKKMDEAIDLLDETIKEVGSIKEKTTELKELINNASDLNLKFEEGIKTINLVTEETKVINKKLESVDKEIKDVNKMINCVNDSIKNMLKYIIACLIIILIFSIINLII